MEIFPDLWDKWNPCQIYIMAVYYFSQNAIFYRTDLAVHKIQEKISEMIYKKHPEIKSDLRKNLLLTAMIFGSSHAYLAYSDEDSETVIESLSKTSLFWASLLH